MLVREKRWFWIASTDVAVDTAAGVAAPAVAAGPAAGMDIDTADAPAEEPGEVARSAATSSADVAADMTSGMRGKKRRRKQQPQAGRNQRKHYRRMAGFPTTHGGTPGPDPDPDKRRSASGDVVVEYGPLSLMAPYHGPAPSRHTGKTTFLCSAGAWCGRVLCLFFV